MPSKSTKSKSPKRTQTRRSISVRGSTYAFLREHCARVSVSMSDFVEQRIADYFQAQKLPVPPPSPRAHQHPKFRSFSAPAARPAPSKPESTTSRKAAPPAPSPWKPATEIPAPSPQRAKPARPAPAPTRRPKDVPLEPPTPPPTQFVDDLLADEDDLPPLDAVPLRTRPPAPHPLAKRPSDPRAQANPGAGGKRMGPTPAAEAGVTVRPTGERGAANVRTDF